MCNILSDPDFPGRHFSFHVAVQFTLLPHNECTCPYRTCDISPNVISVPLPPLHSEYLLRMFTPGPGDGSAHR